MAKRSMATLLKGSPRARKHEKTIRKTLGALKKLEKTGLVKGGFDLESPFGGSRQAGETIRRRVVPENKMTYDA